MTLAVAAPRIGGVAAVARSTHHWVSLYPVVEDTFAELVGKLRERRGLSQTALAEAIGVDRKTMGKIESGQWNPSASDDQKIVRAIAKTLGYPTGVFSRLRGWLPAEEQGDWAAGFLADPTISEEIKASVMRWVEFERRAGKVA